MIPAIVTAGKHPSACGTQKLRLLMSRKNKFPRHPLRIVIMEGASRLHECFGFVETPDKGEEKRSA